MEEKMKKLALPVIGLVTLALLVIACGSPPTPTPPPPLDIFNAATEAAKEVDSVHYDMAAQVAITSEGTAMNMLMTLAGDIQTPDRFKGVMTMDMLGVSVKINMVMISDTIYMTDPTTGKWQTTPVDQAGLAFDPKEMTAFKVEDIEDLAFAGEEKVGDRSAYHLTGKVSSLPSYMAGTFESLGVGGDVNLRADYWIDKETNLALKSTVVGDMTMITEMADTADMSMTMAMSMTMLFSDYNKPVTIEPPEVGQEVRARPDRFQKTCQVSMTLRYSSSISAAIRPQPNCSDSALAPAPILCRISGSAASRRIAAASATASPGGASTMFSPSTSSGGAARGRVVTIAIPCASAA